jgi:hypothetical protein
VPNPAPTDLEVAKLLASISRRITRLAKRHGIDLDRPSEEVECFDPLASESPLLAGICGASVLGRIATGARVGQPVLRVGRSAGAPLVTLSGERQAHAAGFDLHANVAVPAGDKTRLEHLCRYVLRPPVAQDALELTAEGKILLTMRRAWHDGTRAILFEPHELIEKLAASSPSLASTCSCTTAFSGRALGCEARPSRPQGRRILRWRTSRRSDPGVSKSEGARGLHSGEPCVARLGLRDRRQER